MVLQPLSDADVRRRLNEELGTSFFVEAGAGTGKTTAIVGRIVALVASGILLPSGLVAITFTEAAAAELRARVRDGLERAAREEGRPDGERDRCRSAAGLLDEASIDTIHAFAGALLRSYPLEAGLPPNFDTLDQIEQDLEFRERFRAWFEKIADDIKVRDILRWALLLGLTPDQLQAMARALHEQYDLLEKHATWPVARPPSAIEEAARMAAYLRNLRDFLPECLDPTDKLYVKMAEIAFAAERLEQARDDQEALAGLRLLEFWGNPKFVGKQGNWRGDSCKRLKGALTLRIDEATEILEKWRQFIFSALLKSLRLFVLEYAAERKRRGVATFQDLLTWARDLLRDSPEVRLHAQRRWTRIFVDEFQDTDPLQAELTFYLAADPAVPFPENWLEASLEPGKLFLVGDPKQSIYRFRRADIALYQKVQEKAGERVPLSQNFRSVPRILEFVNTHYGNLMKFIPGVQPTYNPLQAEPADSGTGLWFLGGAADEKQPVIWQREAEDVARCCRVALEQQWPVSEGRGAARTTRAARASDICILIPTRTNLRRLERALEAERIPYRIESGELIVMTQEVRDLISCLRAIDDPSDEVALVAALRSPAYGCSDPELLLWREQGGRFNFERPGTGTGARVAAAMTDLHGFHLRRHELSVPALVEDFIERRMLVAASFGNLRPRESWRRQRYVSRRARDFAATGRATLRAFVDWMEGLEREQFRDVSAATGETDEDAVRLLTIHGAKGLEFPIVIMTGWGSVKRFDKTEAVADRIDGKLEVGVGDWKTAGYDSATDRERSLDEAEALRLTYVAATRPKDHLVLSLHRRASSKQYPQAEQFAETIQNEGLGVPVDFAVLGPASELPATAPDFSTPEQQAATEEAWIRNRRELVEALGSIRIVSATGLAKAGADEGAEDVAAFRRGRAGTSLGRAVHAVLQTIDLATLAGLDDLASAQAAAEGITSRTEDIAAAVRSAAASDPVRRALAGGRFWREVPLGGSLEGHLLEGFADLLYEEDGALRVVDYKTDDVPTSAIDRRLERYRLQGGVYAVLVELATGRRVAGVDFVFTSAGETRAVSDLDGVRAAVRARLGELATATHEDEGDGPGGGEGEPEGQPAPAAQTGEDDPADKGDGKRETDQLKLPGLAGP